MDQAQGPSGCSSGSTILPASHDDKAAPRICSSSIPRDELFQISRGGSLPHFALRLMESCSCRPAAWSRSWFASTPWSVSSPVMVYRAPGSAFNDRRCACAWQSLLEEADYGAKCRGLLSPRSPTTAVLAQPEDHSSSRSVPMRNFHDDVDPHELEQRLVEAASRSGREQSSSRRAAWRPWCIDGGGTRCAWHRRYQDAAFNAGLPGAPPPRPLAVRRHSARWNGAMRNWPAGRLAPAFLPARRQRGQRARSTSASYLRAGGSRR